MKGKLLLVVLIVICLADHVKAQTSSEDSIHSIVNADLWMSHDMRITIYPFTYYTPEINFAFGAGGIITFYTAEDQILRPSKIGIAGYYSTSNQYQIGFSPQVYLLQNRIFISVKMFLLDKIYFTPDVDNPEVDAQVYGVLAEVRVPALFAFKEIRKLGFIFDYQHVEIKDDGQDPGENRPHTLGLGLEWSWDTRDHIFYPSSGGLFRAQAVFFSKRFGSSYDFNRYEVDLRRYIGLNAGRNQVLAFQLYADVARGSPPFYRLPALGGSKIMRGYKMGKLRDMHYIAGQIEFRTHIWWRIGTAVFLGIGGVSEEFDKFSLDSMKLSYGIGLRFKFNQKENVNLRVDIGFGENTRGIYFNVEEAF